MQQFPLSRGLNGLAVAACVVCVAVLAPQHAAGDTEIPKDKPDHDHATRARPARWWLEIYAHTMQEEAFLRWMDDIQGGFSWRHTMQEARVNAYWEWWCRRIWDPTHDFGGSHS